MHLDRLCCARITLLVTTAITALPAVCQNTHPSQYAALMEETPSIKFITLRAEALKSEIDKGSDLLVKFDNSKIRQIVGGLPQGDMISIRMEATVRKSNGKETPLPIDNYYLADPGQQTYFSEQTVTNNELGVTGRIPDARLELSTLGLDEGDSIRLRITNVETQESVDKIITIRNFGLVPEITDSFFFLKRLSVSDEEKNAGIDDVNFGPAPGVSYMTIVSVRHNKFMRLLRPGFGLNVSFTDWDDPSFDISTGQFVQGTNANDIEVTVGVVGSLFEDVIQFTYGWNLNVDDNRGYFGIGFSFVNVSKRIGKLLTK